MKTGWAAHLLNSFFGALRACVVMLGLGLMMLSSNHYCPTGQTDCGMAGMETETNDAVCVLACGVPFQYSDDAVHAFVGEVSFLPVSPVLSFSGILTEPDVPPPRTLA